MRQSIKKQVKKAFTLVEILIVVVILGILAAIVIPQFTSATQDAQGGNIASQISTLQRQVELYINKNQNRHPFQNGNGRDGFASFTGWGNMVGDVNGDGDAIDAGEQQLSLMKEAPVNPAHPGTVAQTSTVILGTSAAPGNAAANAWQWLTDTNTLTASYYNETTKLVTPGAP
jgi:general secretion pathway protein G